jgi:hypothetical protein
MFVKRHNQAIECRVVLSLQRKSTTFLSSLPGHHELLIVLLWATTTHYACMRLTSCPSWLVVQVYVPRLGRLRGDGDRIPRIRHPWYLPARFDRRICSHVAACKVVHPPGPCRVNARLQRPCACSHSLILVERQIISKWIRNTIQHEHVANYKRFSIRASLVPIIWGFKNYLLGCHGISYRINLKLYCFYPMSTLHSILEPCHLCGFIPNKMIPSCRFILFLPNETK